MQFCADYTCAVIAKIVNELVIINLRVNKLCESFKFTYCFIIFTLEKLSHLKFFKVSFIKSKIF